MAKKISSTKKSNKINKSRINRKKLKKPLHLKRIKLKKSSHPKNTSNESQGQSENDKIIKVFFDAQATLKLLCCVCNRNITHQIKIILDPSSPNFKTHQKGLQFNALCLNCFIFKSKLNNKDNSCYIGNEITLNNYKYTHYRILPKMTEPLFTSDWSFGEEIKLLGYVEKLGLDNWEEISKALGKGKFECESHYYTFHYKINNGNMPSKNILANGSKDQLKKNKLEEEKLLSKIQVNLGYIPFSDINKTNQSNRSLAKNRNLQKDSQDKNQMMYQSAYDTLGYWAKRKEFDVEYKNEAEIELSELEFKEGDNKNTIKMYYRELQNYNNILEEREERKKLICDKNLFNFKRQWGFEKKLSEEDKGIFQSLKNNFRFLPDEVYFSVFDHNVLEKNIKSRLNQLLYYKGLGCNTYDDIQIHINKVKKENNKNKVDEDENSNVKMSLRDSTINYGNKVDNIKNEEIINEEKKLRKELGLNKNEFTKIMGKIKIDIKKGKKRNEVIIQEIKEKYHINKANAAKFVELVNRKLKNIYR